MTENEALEGCFEVPVVDAIAEINQHGLTAWVQDGILVASEDDDICQIVAVIDGQVNTKPIMEFLGY